MRGALNKDLTGKGEISLYEIGCNGGRPAKYKNSKEIEEVYAGYELYCFDNRLPITITGACLFMGFSSRQSFYDYGKKKAFSYTIKRIHLAVENYYETLLHNGKNPGGPIFALKNLGWTDVHRIDKNIKHEIPEINIVLSAEKRDELPDKK